MTTVYCKLDWGDVILITQEMQQQMAAGSERQGGKKKKKSIHHNVCLVSVYLLSDGQRR